MEVSKRRSNMALSLAYYAEPAGVMLPSLAKLVARLLEMLTI